MSAEVDALIAGTGHGLSLLDVDADPSLKARYGRDVPLLFDGDIEICRHRLNLAAFREWLRANA